MPQNDNYRYLIAPETFQRLRVHMVEQGCFPYGDAESIAVVMTKIARPGHNKNWWRIRVEQKSIVIKGKHE